MKEKLGALSKSSEKKKKKKGKKENAQRNQKKKVDVLKRMVLNKR
jgi:hypothetical protein